MTSLVQKFPGRCPIQYPDSEVLYVPVRTHAEVYGHTRVFFRIYVFPMSGTTAALAGMKLQGFITPRISCRGALCIIDCNFIALNMRP